MNEKYAGRERERREIMTRFITELEQHLLLERIDPDGQLRQTAQVLEQKRGCRR